MSDTKQPIVIVKKIKKNKQGHHGGSWKIAYADFVTAMMAFFMLLWLLSLLNKYQLQGISEYFKKPLKDAFVGSKHPNLYENQKKENINKIKQKDGGISKPITEKKTPSSAEVQKEKENIKQNLEISLQNNKQMKAFKDNLNFEVVKDGIKVSLHDSSTKHMFSSGKADFQNYARQVLSWLSHEFNKIPKKIIITGHTDSHSYGSNAQYTNWELSSDRAHAVRRLLLADGMQSDKIIRIEGAADTSLLDDSNGDNPLNRRVEITILTDEASKRIINE